MSVKQQTPKVYRGENCNRIAFPMGGIGAGMVCLEGTGSLSHVSLRHKPEVFNEPMMFSALFVKGAPTARVLEGQVPGWKAFGPSGSGNGGSQKNYGLPRFSDCAFSSQFPFATVKLSDSSMPVDVELTGWSPFIPGDADASSLPVFALEYTIKNNSKRLIEAVYSFHSANFMSAGTSVRPVQGGFVFNQPQGDSKSSDEGSFAAFIDDSAAVSDCAWFRGGWFDPLTMLWNKVMAGDAVAKPPHPEENPGNGGSIYLPFKLKPDEEKIICLQAAWYVPRSTLTAGMPDLDFLDSGWRASRLMPAISNIDSAAYIGLEQNAGWEDVPESNFVSVHGMRGGSGVVYLARRFSMKAAGRRTLNIGHDGGVRIFVDGKVVAATTGTVKPAPPTRTPAVIDLKAGEHEICVALDRAGGEGWGFFASLSKPAESCGCTGGDCSKDKTSGNETCYVPWYAAKFDCIDKVIACWRKDAARLRNESRKFSDCFFDTTLAAEVVEAVAANLTILKSPTCLRQADGRFWGWEGCCDCSGCCSGSCTHVWNYAQAMPHLFPLLERSLRETEFNECQDERGHQNFRAPLPIRPADHKFHAAADGQLGGIMKMYREWRISGDKKWLKSLWPKVKQSLLYCIGTWDPDHNGLLVEPHHNTYDIEFWGVDGMCSSFYLGALSAAVAMGKVCGDDTTLFESLLAKGHKRMDSELWNGEYFIQKVQWEGLRAGNPVNNPAKINSMAYTPEALAILTKEGPKYQYGNGCLSDGVLGDWIARCCGIDSGLSTAKVKKHLASVFTHNFKTDLSSHSNPQRPTYALGREAGLLLCSWPNGGKPNLPFVYSDEVWTGIEYQVAAHLIMTGQVKNGLKLVQAVRKRYDGRIRNPFNEYECGHWYARAMSSYGLLQALSGARYDAVDKTLYMSPAVKSDFKAFISTATGYGTVGIQHGKPFMNVVSGDIDIRRIVFNGVEIKP